MERTVESDLTMTPVNGRIDECLNRRFELIFNTKTMLYCQDELEKCTLDLLGRTNRQNDSTVLSGQTRPGDVCESLCHGNCNMKSKNVLYASPALIATRAVVIADR